MADLVQMLDKVAAPTSRKSRPKKALSGLRRKMAQHLRNYLLIVRRGDTGEASRGSSLGYTPVLVLDGLDSKTDKAWLTVLKAVERALDVKA